LPAPPFSAAITTLGRFDLSCTVNCICLSPDAVFA
jgi:hypothetical protein